jgi:hypothetical protein
MFSQKNRGEILSIKLNEACLKFLQGSPSSYLVKKNDLLNDITKTFKLYLLL